MAKNPDERILLERAVIWFLASDEEGPMPAGVIDDWFEDPVARTAWRHMAEGRAQGQRVDHSTLLGALGPQYAELMEHELTIVSTTTLTTALHGLRQAVLRSMMRQWARNLMRHHDDPEAAIAQLAQQAQDALTQHRPPTGHTAFDMAMRHYALVEERNKPASERPKPLLFGVDTLDALVQGIGPGEVIFIGGRPKKGKTQWALNLTRYWLRTGRSVVYFSFEMVHEEISSRLIAMQANLASKLVDRHPIQGAALTEYIAAQGWLSEQRLTVYDTPMTWGAIAAYIRHHHLHQEADIVVIDHFGLITREPRPGENTNDTLGKIVRGIKNLAQELRLPIVVISQLSRAVEGRQDKRPQMHDFRDTGEIEQSANLVLTLWQPLPSDIPETHGRRDIREMPVECYIAAYRSGPAYAGVLLEWNRETGQMTDGGLSPYKGGEK